MIRWGIHIQRAALAKLHALPRDHVSFVVNAIQALAENPLPTIAQVSHSDPSAYWIAVEGDHVVTYEIIDEKHIIVILLID